MDYYTIDFETANASLASACSIGIVGVENGKIVSTRHILINPDEEFSYFNVGIHHITPDMVRDALKFNEVWPEIESVFADQLVFAHNAGFDFAVLNKCLEKYGLVKPTFRFGCTVQIARKLWPNHELINHRLHTVAGHLEIELDHHNALSDASACVAIIERGMKMHQVDTPRELYDRLELRFGLFSPTKYRNTTRLPRRRKQSVFIAQEFFLDSLFVLSGSPSKLQKSELIKQIEARGGFVDTRVDVHTDYLVVLENAKKEHIMQVLALQAQGSIIALLTEEELEEKMK